MTTPGFSPEYLRVSINLLGKDIRSLSPDRVDRYERMLYDFNMGHYTAETMTPFSSVLFQKSEYAFYHPLSLHEAMKRYGFNKLEGIIPMDVYLNLPASMIDETIEGITEGKKARFEADKRKEAENPDKETVPSEMSNLAKLLQEVISLTSKAQ